MAPAILATLATTCLLAGFVYAASPDIGTILWGERRQAAIEANRHEDAGGTQLRPGIDGMPELTERQRIQEELRLQRLQNSIAGYAFPPNGTSEWLADSPPTYPAPVVITDLTRNGFRKVIIFYDRASDAPVLRLYLRPNETAEIDLPPGLYQASIEQGDAWCAEEKSFCQPENVFSPPIFRVREDGARVTIE